MSDNGDAASIPNPGSPEAVALGCRCPRMDNAHGAGVHGAGMAWVTRNDCPLHGEARAPNNDADQGGG